MDGLNFLLSQRAVIEPGLIAGTFKLPGRARDVTGNGTGDIKRLRAIGTGVDGFLQACYRAKMQRSAAAGLFSEIPTFPERPTTSARQFPGSDNNRIGSLKIRFENTLTVEIADPVAGTVAGDFPFEQDATGIWVGKPV